MTGVALALTAPFVSTTLLHLILPQSSADEFYLLSRISNFLWHISCTFALISQGMCPKADDPVTVDQSNRQILLHLASDGSSLSGSVKITLLGHTVDFDLGNSFVATDSYCKSQLEKADNTGTVSCTATTGM